MDLLLQLPLLAQIIVGCLLGGLLSVLAAALVMFGLPRRWFGLIVSLAVGLMLSTALLKLMPEALETGMPAHTAFPLLLGGIIAFFMLERSMLWRHSHHHEHSQEQCVHDHHGKEAPLVVLGDSFHNFTDGVLIAAAFLADPTVGWSTTLAVLAHEVPHHIGDMVVLRATGGQRSAALLKVSLAGAVTTVGGITGWWLVDRLHDYLPYFLVVASSSFIYVALADLIPQLQKRLSARGTAAQIIWLLLGIALVTVVSGLTHRN